MPPHQLEPDLEAEPAAKRYATAFLNCLTPEACHYITYLPTSWLSQSQLSTLQRYNDHFTSPARPAQSTSLPPQPQSMPTPSILMQTLTVPVRSQILPSPPNFTQASAHPTQSTRTSSTQSSTREEQENLAPLHAADAKAATAVPIPQDTSSASEPGATSSQKRKVTFLIHDADTEFPAHTDSISQGDSSYDDGEVDDLGDEDGKGGKGSNPSSKTPFKITGKSRGRPKGPASKTTNATTTKAPYTQNSAFDKSWGAIMTLKSLSLDPALVALLGANSNSSPEVLLALFVDPSSLSLGEKSNNQVTVQTFAKACQRVASIPCTPNDARRTVGRLFCHLAIGDMASSIFTRRALDNEKMNKKYIGARIGNKAYDAVQPVIRKASQLVFLRERFRTGSLFILQNQLTDHFLLNRVTHSGNFFEGAKSHLLNTLKLDECIEKSGVEDLGDAIRQALLNMYGHGSGRVVAGEEKGEEEEEDVEMEEAS